MANKWINLSSIERITIEGALLNTDKGDSKDREAIAKKLRKADKKIAISSAKGKGRALQQDICRKISTLIDIPFDNSDDSCLIHSREMGQSGVDVILRGEAQKKFPFAVECKSTEQISLRNFISQAKLNTKEGIEWLVVLRTKSLTEDIVIMSWETFEKLFNGGKVK